MTCWHSGLLVSRRRDAQSERELRDLLLLFRRRAPLLVVRRLADKVLRVRQAVDLFGAARQDAKHQTRRQKANPCLCFFQFGVVVDSTCFLESARQIPFSMASFH